MATVYSASILTTQKQEITWRRRDLKIFEKVNYISQLFSSSQQKKYKNLTTIGDVSLPPQD